MKIFSFLKSIYQAYVTALMESHEIEKAVKLFPRVYTRPKQWDDQILDFMQRNELDVSKKNDS